MVVTKIERQKRHPDRVNLYLDGDFTMGVHVDVLSRIGLRTGDTLTQEKLETLQSLEEFNLAKQKALRLIGRRLRSENEVRSRLLEKEFAPKIVDEVIDHLHTLRLID